MFEALKNLFHTMFSPVDTKNSRAQILIRGDRLVKGGYSVEIEKRIYSLHVYGWMRPTDTFIEFDLEAPKPKIEELLTHLKTVPSWTRVDRIELAWNDEKKGYRNFRVRS